MNKVKDNKLAGYRGFTLIEILLVMLITSILVLGVNTAYRQAHLIWSNVENRRPTYYTARLITETLRKELSCLYFPPTTDQDNSRFRLLFLPHETTELAFYTLTPSWKGSLESCRIAKVSYRFTKDPHTEETVLQRFEQPYAGEKMIGKESSDVVVRGLSDFSVWVIDPNSGSYVDLWKQSYNSKDTPPKALKVSLKWAATEEVPEISFQSYILIPVNCSVF
ncbi:MAG: prepilin-type N-terminal cleavage/methylation domain-containing protein [Desulfobacteraceae bacterium]|nr:prepilin-type N-terminal cleavage/methylation domain-containing protein [Desulfobacteraceae bacterium]